MPKQALSSLHSKLGHAVRVQRARLSVSQEEAGKRAGMHRNYVGAIERGEINPTYETLSRLANGLSMPLHLLIEEATSEKTVDSRPARRRRRAREGN